ncbi:DNA polymerase delta subunit 4 isoform X2 [Aquarana catesbeiana]|uniref:DNA polymerase delta subunit 4 isoform X2 n=1 Tax=Aquarana catesbeiana TaxID=8400 RepID=UPI003CCA6D83
MIVKHYSNIYKYLKYSCILNQVQRDDPTARGSSHIEAVDAPTPKLTPLEKLVRFDLDWNFGPCTGISRMERWQRAQTLDLMPPQDIKQILLEHSSDPQFQHNLWSTYAI